MTFDDLGLDQTLLRAVARQGYTTPTPIQQRAIPAVLDGGDVLAAAQTGTGKTAAFTLPLLHLLQQNHNPNSRNPRVLILTPTRELAAQVADSVATYGSELPLRSTVVFGGVGPNPQIKAFRKGLDLLIATPGRLLDHAQQGNVDLSDIEVLVLDEADRMLDMGFIRDIRKIIAKLPEQRQNLLFSATFSGEIRKLARGLLHQPVEVEVSPRNTTVERIEQRVSFIPQRNKRELLSWLISSNNWQQVLVFTRTKHGANRVCKQLTSDGLPAAALHGNKSQSARTKALADFKDGKLRVLVATDIAARGIDIDMLPHVINFELPNVPEDYVHRIGRTGRAGKEGEALSLVDAEEKKHLRGIERLIKQSIPVLEHPDFVPSANPPQDHDERGERPPRRRSGARSGGGGNGGQNNGQPRRKKPGAARSGSGGGGGHNRPGNRPSRGRSSGSSQAS